MRIRTLVVFFLMVIMVIAGCSTPSTNPAPTFELEPTKTPVSPTAVPHTPTPPSPVSILLAPPGGNPRLVDMLTSEIKEQAQKHGLRFQVRESLTEQDFQLDPIDQVIVLAPYPALADLVQEAPETSFLAVGFPELEVSQNLSVVRSGEDKLDIHGFVAGYTAAMITPDWRVAALGLQENEAAQAARQAFVLGAKYYCGLCLPKYAPTGVNYLYPKYVEFPLEVTEAEKQASARFLVDRAVETIYVVPGAGSPELYQALLEMDVSIIGSGEDYQPAYQGSWAASLSFDLPGTVVGYLPDFFNGEVGLEISTPLIVEDVNHELLSEGRLREAREILEEVSQGWISTTAE